MVERIDMMGGGLIDDLVVDEVTVRLVRSGTARYSLRLRGADVDLEIEIWTTERGRIRIATDDPLKSDWYRISCGSGSVSLVETGRCTAHLENMDRAVVLSS